MARDEPYTARSEFESALTHSPNHPGAIVGLSNILLDVYSEDLRLPPAIPPLEGQAHTPEGVDLASNVKTAIKTLPSSPLGLGPALSSSSPSSTLPSIDNKTAEPLRDDQLPAPYKATSLPLIDRLAARDRAYALLSGLTKLGDGWNLSEAWFALARAHEESGQPEKAKEVLWWCVELEEGSGIRDLRCLSGGGYII